MRWEHGRRSDNIEDRRGARMGGAGVKVGGLGMLVILVLALLLGVNPLQVMDMMGGAPTQVSVPPQTAPGGARPTDPAAEFVAVILADTEDTWSQIFAQSGGRYQPPRLVLFDGATPSACGLGQAAMGPFYCPADGKVYLDLSFFRELDRRFGAPGDFAQAYVVAHEVGHHIQNLLGIAPKVHEMMQRVSREQANELSVRMELQADCLAGVWAHHAHRQRQLLEEGDVEEGLRAAAAIGDDTIQRKTQGHVVPEAWTHGSSEQRVRWFKRGMASGQVGACDTFKAASL
ncbi:MAG TPA: neutral zinc metallopeptidase [Pelomicrobium sp.]|nr:neutral zinc metallopeptidase [Pelomicrobium sp.]